jgi:hypothetical protein
VDTDKLSRAAALRAEADALEELAFKTRPLPDFWRVGQKVRTLGNHFAWSKGAIRRIVELRDPGTPADQYQVFWTSPDNGQGVFWTIPSDVELVEDVQ